MKIPSKSLRLLEWPAFPSLILVTAFFITSGILSPVFFTENYLPSFIAAYIPLIVLSIGQFVVLITGGIDISIGAIMTLVNVLAVHMIGLGYEPVIAFLLAALAGLGFGAINGFVIALLRVNPLLVTLASQSVAGGIALAILPAPGGAVPSGYVLWYMDAMSFIPYPILFLLIMIGLWVLIYFSPLGIQLFAVGDNVRMAFVSSVHVRKVQFFAYFFASFAAVVAGIAVSGSIGSGSASVGLPLTMNSIAACVIGGISLLGGKGNIAGAILGAIFLALVFNIVISINVSPYIQGLISGLIVLVCVVATSGYSIFAESRTTLRTKIE
jgi:ribose transport system permease protein